MRVCLPQKELEVLCLCVGKALGDSKHIDTLHDELFFMVDEEIGVPWHIRNDWELIRVAGARAAFSTFAKSRLVKNIPKRLEDYVRNPMRTAYAVYRYFLYMIHEVCTIAAQEARGKTTHRKNPLLRAVVEPIVEAISFGEKKLILTGIDENIIASEKHESETNVRKIYAYPLI